MNTPVAAARVPDYDALLAALVLAPAVYSRNRFFDMFRDPAIRNVRARAAQLRSLARHLAGKDRERADHVERTLDDQGRTVVRYRIRMLTIRRTIALLPLEADIVDVACARLRAQQPPEDASGRVQEVLRRLAQAA